MRQVKYVCHILREGKQLPDPSKCSAIAQWQWEDIKTLTALKGFLGLANWYSICIHKYAEYAAPLMEALRGKYLYETPDQADKEKLDGNGKPIKRKKDTFEANRKKH